MRPFIGTGREPINVGGGSQHFKSDHRQEVGGACRSGEGRKLEIFCFIGTFRSPMRMKSKVQRRLLGGEENCLNFWGKRGQNMLIGSKA